MSGIANTGVVGYVSNPVAQFPRNSITVDIFGNVFYRDYEFGAGDDTGVYWSDEYEYSKEQMIFFAAAMSVALEGKYSYGNKLRSSQSFDIKMSLPVKDGKIDYKFMEKYIAELEAQRIAELEAQRIAELEAYLSATGLKDYNFTAEEENALSEFCKCEWVEYDIPSVFEVRNTNSIMSRDVVENSGTIPYLCASSENNGVSSYISYNENCIDRGNCIFIGGKTFVVSYQERDFFSNDSHNLSLTLLEEKWREKRVQLFLATCVRKSLGHKYSWGDSISHSKIMSDTISLPVIDGEINYGVMSAFVRAIEKLVIRDVVDYADKKIAMTRQVCAG